MLLSSKNYFMCKYKIFHFVIQFSKQFTRKHLSYQISFEKERSLKTITNKKRSEITG